MKDRAKRPLTAELVPWRLLCSADTHVHAFLLLIAATIFSNGVRLGMAFDDDSAVVNNPDAYVGKTSLGSIFFNDFWGKPIDSFESNGSYRPITVLTFRIQHWLMGYRHSPAFLHGFNYAIAYLNVCLVFYLARLYVYMVVPSAVLAVENAKAHSLTALLTSPVYAVPLMAALLFLVHPVHVDAVTSIVGRSELLYCLFGLIGFFCIHRYLNQVDETAGTAPVTAAPPAKQSKGARVPQKPSRKHVSTEHYVVLSIWALAISVLCKDSAITFTAVYGVHACVMYACGRCQRRHSFMVIVLAVVELLGYLAFRREFVGNVDLRTNPLLSQSEQPQYFVPKGLFHWLSIRWLIQMKNLELLFFPTSLCNEYSFNCIPHVHSMQDPRVPSFLAITGAAVLTLLSLLFGTFALRSRAALAGLAGFLWMAIPYAPVSHLFVAVGTFIAERCLYVPSIGAVLLITFIVAAPGLRDGVVARYFYALLLLCVGWGVFSHRRNDDWQSNEHLSRAATRTCPNSGKAHFQLAAAVAAREKSVTPEVAALARRSLELDPSSHRGYYHLALYELHVNDDKRKAYEYLRKCLDDRFAYMPCDDLYRRVRSVVYPEMTEVEQYVDLATVVHRDSYKAVYLRHAGIIALERDAKPCLAKTLLHRAMTRWNNSNVYWMSDEVSRGAGDSTYCNALYWYEQSFLQCEKQLMAGGVESAREEEESECDDTDDDAHLSSSQPSRKVTPPTPQEAVRRAAAAAEHFRHCGTDWHRFLSEPTYNYITIPHRMTDYVLIGSSTASFIAHFINYTARDTPARNTLLLIYLDTTLRRYCHFSALLHDDYVNTKIGRLFKDKMQTIVQEYSAMRGTLVSEIQMTVRDLRGAIAMPPSHAAKRGRSHSSGVNVSERQPNCSASPRNGGNHSSRQRSPAAHAHGERNASGVGRGRGTHPHKLGALRLKKGMTKYHEKKFREQRGRQQTHQGSGPSRIHADPARSGSSNQTRPPRMASSSRTKDIDIHLAAKVSADLRESLNVFKTRRANQRVFCQDLNERLFRFVPPPLIQQHMPDSVSSFRTYLSRFQKGAPTMVSAFLSWYEWASFEANKGKTFSKPQSSGAGTTAAEKDDDDEEAAPVKGEAAADGDGKKASGRKLSQTHQVMSQTLKEREHMRALLHMCLRHNAEKRKQGQHAFLNHLNAKLSEDDVDARNLERLRGSAHHSVLYALSRLLLGMVTDDFAMLCLHCHSLFLVMAQTTISPAVVLELMDEEFALSARMKAVKLRLDDPTKGERNQRLMATVFALGAVVASQKRLRLPEASQLATVLAFAYVEQKATRVLSANVLFQVLAQHSDLYQQEEPLQWLTFAFFHYPKMEYFRPEAIQLLLRLMETDAKPPARALPATVEEYLTLDPLSPTTMEQISNALFRKEQVTAYHPMVHPVWHDIFQLVVRRVAMGESMKEHLGTILHNMIVPYRRGSADVPRRALFQNLVTELGYIAVQSDHAEQRMEVLKLASTHVEDLLRQYAMTADSDPAAVTNRTWVLRELRNCLYVPVREGVDHAYVDAAVMRLLEFGLFPPRHSRDTLSQNRCIYLFADVYSFTFHGPLARPKSSVAATTIITAYLAAEEKSKTRYTTAVQHSAFRKSRNRVVEALEVPDEQRSVLFYERADMDILLALLFLMLSVDDPTNSDAMVIAKSVIPDLAQFYTAGTLETLDLFLDALMALLMRTSAPLHVMPLMTCVRRIAMGFVLKFAKFIRTKSTLDILLAPLKDAYHTDSREQARQRKAKQAAEDGDRQSSSDEDGGGAGASSDGDSVGGDGGDEAAEGGAGSNEDDASSSVEESSTETVSATDAFEEEEAPTQQYIDALKGMVGGMDLDHVYPTGTASQEKADVVRAIRLATRVGLAMRSAEVVHVYQVLLAVARENVKTADDVVFHSAVSSLEMLLLTKNRYFGSFVAATDLFQLLGDIQSYLRKLSRVLLSKDSVMAKAAAAARRRLVTVKGIALRVFHFVAMLASKNHAGEEVRIVLSEYYKSVFCDRGWDTKKLLPSLKKDLYHYRQGFAWALLPAVLEKNEEVLPLEGPQRVRVFTGCCVFVEAMLPRLSGLPGELKRSASAAICGLVQSVSVAQVFAMKHTLPYNYLHMVKMVLQYNSRVQLDPAWVASAVIAPAVDDDDILLSAASIRLLGTMERMLGLTPRARETKAPSPVKLLYEQFVKRGAKEKSDFYRRAKKVRSRVLKALLAHRNDDPTDEERSAKRRRKEELKIEDRLQRQVLRSARSKALTKEEREEKRKRIMMAKQERIAKNRERKRRLHEARQRSFEKWRQAKLAAASQVDNEDD
ncbi:hypothetical protein CGC20_16735 [Leishmania donovani]|uniref:DUF1736 domain-containing protein n=1 Tax=Leishmania donovani TaxID=5661 RepID=A0A504Y213_LEIDO|nr:hypothetical protein CGC20_16735 [Leishmania donovani]